MPKPAVSGEQFTHRILQQLLDTLVALPGVQARPDAAVHALQGPDLGYDATIDLDVVGRPLALLVEVKSRTIYPREVRQILWRIRSLAERAAVSTVEVPVLAAECLSPGAKELLRAEQVGYFDSGGSLFLSAPGLYVHIDKPPPPTGARVIRALFAGARAQTLHALLLRGRDWLGVKQLAELAQVSPATASEVLGELEKFDWIATRGRGPNKERRLVEPGAVLDEWVRQRAVSRQEPLGRYFVPGGAADALVERAAQAFDAHGVSYAMTQEAAAQRYAPYLSHVARVHCRVLTSPQADAALTELGARPVNEGANLLVHRVKSMGDLLFSERLGEVWLASPILVYLDLLRGEGRAAELAAHLRMERIGY